MKHTAMFGYRVLDSKTGEELARVAAPNKKEAAEWAIERFGKEKVLVQRGIKR